MNFLYGLSKLLDNITYNEDDDFFSFESLFDFYVTTGVCVAFIYLFLL